MCVLREWCDILLNLTPCELGAKFWRKLWSRNRTCPRQSSTSHGIPTYCTFCLPYLTSVFLSLYWRCHVSSPQTFTKQIKIDCQCCHSMVWTGHLHKDIWLKIAMWQNLNLCILYTYSCRTEAFGEYLYNFCGLCSWFVRLEITWDIFFNMPARTVTCQSQACTLLLTLLFVLQDVFDSVSIFLENFTL